MDAFQNSVFSRELLRSGRSLRLFLVRGVVPLAIGGLMIAFFLGGDQQAGIHAFHFLVVLFNVFTLGAMPLLISGVLYEEWHSNTLSLLVLTETSLGRILQGLLASRVVLALANLFACFPLLVSVMMFGGVTVEQLVQFSVLIVSLAVLYGAFSLWGACVVRGRERALGVSLGCLLAPQGAALCLHHFARDFVPGIEWVPAVAMYRLTADVLPWLPGGRGDWLSINLGCLALAALFVLLARRRLERAIGGGAGRGPEEVASLEASRGPITGNPLSWLVLRRFDPLLGLPRRVTLALTLAGVLGVELVTASGELYFLRLVTGGLGLALMCWTFFWACLVSAQTWMEERTQRTLELLLATPYSLDEIVLWKVDALFWALVTPTLSYSLLVSVLLPVPSVGLKLLGLVPFSICCFLYSYVGLLVIVYLTIFFAIKAAGTVQAVILTFGSLAAIGLLNYLLVYLAEGAGVLLAVPIDGALLFGFLPPFRRRLRGFEPA